MIANADQQDDRDHVLLRLPADDGTRDGRAELGAEHRTADEADEAQRANDKALPVARDRERDGNDDEGEIKQITAHGVHGIRCRLITGCHRGCGPAPMTRLEYRYAAPWGSSRMTVASQGRSQPPSASSRSVISAVKPQISIESMRNAGPLRPLGEPEHEPVRGVGEVGDADPLHRRDLADVHRPDGGRAPATRRARG